jgi:hypothetical protein
MKRIGVVFTIIAFAVLSGCATGYGSNGLNGGYEQRELEPGTWRVTFEGTGFTELETVQTFWLYRAAELTVQKGYDGFQILSPIQLTSGSQIIPGTSGAQLYDAQVFFTPNIPRKRLVADIKMLKAPVTNAPPKVFGAAKLLKELEPYVKGMLCDYSNVCPHSHSYLRPDDGA